MIGCDVDDGYSCEQTLMETGHPALVFMFVESPTIFIGKQYRTTKVLVDKAIADGIKVRRYEPKGKAMLIGRQHELILSFIVGRDYHEGKFSLLIPYMDELVMAGFTALGIPTMSANIRKQIPYLGETNQTCAFAIELGNIVTTAYVKIAITAFSIRHGTLSGNAIISIKEPFDIIPYMETPWEKINPTYIEECLGRTVPPREIADAFKAGFATKLEIFDQELSQQERARMEYWKKTKYQTDEWIHSKWLPQRMKSIGGHRP